MALTFGILTLSPQTEKLGKLKFFSEAFCKIF
jgi:hypothetical protein